MNRRVVIGVMGGDENVGVVKEEAQLLGAAIAEAGAILLTGGCIRDNNDVKNASMYGAKQSEMSQGTTARLIGILPNGAPRCCEDTSRRFFLRTSLTGVERDAINGVTPDVLIFFPGSCGTLCELTFAVVTGKPVLFWNAITVLRERHEVHVKDHNLSRNFIGVALDACNTKLGPISGINYSTTTQNLMCLLDGQLAQANDFRGTIKEIVRAACDACPLPTLPSGFPGLLDTQGSKRQFETMLQRISA